MRAMVRHPIGPVALVDDPCRGWTLIGREILADISREIEMAALARQTPPAPAWCDDASMGTLEAFDAWVDRHGLRSRIRDPQDDRAPMLVMTARMGIRSLESVGRELRALGWHKPRGKDWRPKRPRPISVAGEICS
jgi:hypothetical protein